jgi:dipeptidyl aminopeptidase/acylaminoacyl peptidase
LSVRPGDESIRRFAPQKLREEPLFVGHFGLGLAGKLAVPKVSLGTLFLSVRLADALWARGPIRPAAERARSRTVRALRMARRTLGILDRPASGRSIGTGYRIGGNVPNRSHVFGTLIAAALAGAAAVSAADRRPVTLDDLARERGVSEPELSPDGAWVAYVVSSIDTKEDRRARDLWMTSWDGKQTLRLTSSKSSETTPRFSPDGKSLGFLSSRGDSENDTAQLWLLPRAGGEAEKVTEFKGGVEDYAWSPDGKRVVLDVEDPDPDAPAEGSEGKKEKTPKPIVIDRFQFKEDVTGYLGKTRRHLYLLDVATRQSQPLTTGTANELLPAWSPDGKSIAFVSKRGADIDRTDNWDVYVIEAKSGAVEKKLTTFDGSDNAPDIESRLAWSPDGKWIAYFQGGPDRLIYYAGRKLAVVPAAGGPARVLTEALDRNVQSPVFSDDGKQILFLLEDDGTMQLARIPAAGGPVERIVSGRRVVTAFTTSPGGKVAMLVSSPTEPDEVWALDGKTPRRLTHQNDAWLAELSLGAVEETSFASKDGTEIHGFLAKPPDYQAGRRYPAILRIHGGPVDQIASAFDIDWQVLAAQGYVVLGANPRGSSGRGEKYSLGIWADWGNKDVEDVLAAVDDAVRRGIADPDRLGVGGWSYGGMLTNYVIAKDARFAAATSGASISNILAGYGTDQYIREYEAELGLPWKNTDGWVKVSFPFLHADRIRTPTLFLCGESDFNVPLLNSEQMYQALRSLGVPTELVIYPDQYHGLRRPSFLRDRLARYIAWYDKYVKPGRKEAGTTAGRG